VRARESPGRGSRVEDEGELLELCGGRTEEGEAAWRETGGAGGELEKGGLASAQTEDGDGKGRVR
jgi:hypothetical protein